MYTILLPSWLSCCPSYWRNFISYCRNTDRYSSGTSISTLINLLNDNLIHYNGYVYSRHSFMITNSYIEFDSEEDALAFKLRFG